ncbi:MAG: tetratricopeptide repeat protein, partial [Crocosphaera sp.]
PQTVAQKIVAPFKVQEGEKLAKEGKYKEAVTAYQEAQKLDPNIKIEANSWNSLCWFGSLNKQAKEVLDACENAVKNAPNDQSKAGYTDSRGLGRALTGNIEGAIKDFQVFVDSPDVSDESKNKRKQWIETLKKGENPFTDEVLEELKNE